MLLGALLTVGINDGKVVGAKEVVGRIDGLPCGAVLTDGIDDGSTVENSLGVELGVSVGMGVGGAVASTTTGDSRAVGTSWSPQLR